MKASHFGVNVVGLVTLVRNQGDPRINAALAVSLAPKAAATS